MSVGEQIRQLKASLPPHCKLIAVTKTHPPEAILQAYNAGHRIMGENKVQELLEKVDSLPKDIEWHLIGHLQTNKVKYIAPFIAMIHSIDSLKLLTEINKQAGKCKRKIDCLLQVHIATEDTKFGLSPAEAIELLTSAGVENLSFVNVVGLMGMASFTDDVQQIRSEFRTLKQLFDDLSLRQLPSNVAMRELSMGMSSDFRIAIEEGSTMVRVGSAIFGTRNYQKQ